MRRGATRLIWSSLPTLPSWGALTAARWKPSSTLCQARNVRGAGALQNLVKAVFLELPECAWLAKTPRLIDQCSRCKASVSRGQPQGSLACVCACDQSCPLLRGIISKTLVTVRAASGQMPFPAHAQAQLRFASAQAQKMFCHVV